MKQGLSAFSWSIRPIRKKGGFAFRVGSIIIFIGILSATVGHFLIPYDPVELDLSNRLAPPTMQHLFGTDEYGRDVFSRVIDGTQISLFTAFSVLMMASTFGIIVGALSGLSGGIVDEVLMRITDIFLSFPPLILSLAVAGSIGTGMLTTITSLAIAFWPYYARLIRIQVMSLREKEYILAAISLGSGRSRLVFRHLLPNVMNILIVKITLDIGYTILSAAALSFLGVGIQPPIPEWGSMIFESRNYFREAWWSMFFPGIVLAFTCIGFNLFGDGLRQRSFQTVDIE